MKSTISLFRDCHDQLALDYLLNSISDLEDLIEYQQNVGISGNRIDDLVPILKLLLDKVKNNDVIGMTDLLEFKLTPIVEKWIKGCGEE